MLNPKQFRAFDPEHTGNPHLNVANIRAKYDDTDRVQRDVSTGRIRALRPLTPWPSQSHHLMHGSVN